MTLSIAYLLLTLRNLWCFINSAGWDILSWQESSLCVYQQGWYCRFGQFWSSCLRKTHVGQALLCIIQRLPTRMVYLKHEMRYTILVGNPRIMFVYTSCAYACACVMSVHVYICVHICHILYARGCEREREREREREKQTDRQRQREN